MKFRSPDSEKCIFLGFLEITHTYIHYIYRMENLSRVFFKEKKNKRTHEEIELKRFITQSMSFTGCRIVLGKMINCVYLEKMEVEV